MTPSPLSEAPLDLARSLGVFNDTSKRCPGPLTPQTWRIRATSTAGLLVIGKGVTAEECDAGG
jgi:hypothetical protein